MYLSLILQKYKLSRFLRPALNIPANRRNHVKKLEALCFEDQLTGMGNRHAMNEYIAAMEPEKSIGILFCDVMGLKKVSISSLLSGRQTSPMAILAFCFRMSILTCSVFSNSSFSPIPVHKARNS